jgi:hypothetical protein
LPKVPGRGYGSARGGYSRGGGNSSRGGSRRPPDEVIVGVVDRISDKGNLLIDEEWYNVSQYTKGDEPAEGDTVTVAYGESNGKKWANRITIGDDEGDEDEAPARRSPKRASPSRASGGGGGRVNQGDKAESINRSVALKAAAETHQGGADGKVVLGTAGLFLQWLNGDAELVDPDDVPWDDDGAEVTKRKVEQTKRNARSAKARVEEASEEDDSHLELTKDQQAVLEAVTQVWSAEEKKDAAKWLSENGVTVRPRGLKVTVAGLKKSQCAELIDALHSDFAEAFEEGEDDD